MCYWSVRSRTLKTFDWYNFFKAQKKENHVQQLDYLVRRRKVSAWYKSGSKNTSGKLCKFTYFAFGADALANIAFLLETWQNRISNEFTIRLKFQLTYLNPRIANVVFVKRRWRLKQSFTNKEIVVVLLSKACFHRPNKLTWIKEICKRNT